LFATLGVVRYELRNTQLYDATMQRLRSLEAQLGFEKTRSKGGREVYIWSALLVV
jgi:hypothetical protein